MSARRLIGGLTLMLALLLLGAGFRPVQQEEKPLALGGYDPIAYFEEGKPRKGSPFMEWTDPKTGLAWRFCSRTRLVLFSKRPEHYTPIVIGPSADPSEAGKLQAAQPHLFRISRGRLYLFTDQATLARWESRREKAKLFAGASNRL